MDLQAGLPIVQTAVDTLTNIHEGYKTRQQREKHFHARLVFEHRLAAAQRKNIEEASKTQRRLQSYPLSDYGYLAELLPDDGLPAILVSEINNRSLKLASPTIKPFVTAALARISETSRTFHDCSGSFKSKSSTIEGKFHALELCVNEFFNRPAFVVYHESDGAAVYSYMLVWNIFPKGSGITWDQVRIAEIRLSQEGDSLRTRDASHASLEQDRDNQLDDTDLKGACLLAICAALDGYSAFQNMNPDFLLQKVLSEAPGGSGFQHEAYLNILKYIVAVENGEVEPYVYSLSPFLLWLEDEFHILYSAGYDFSAQEQPGGSVTVIVDIGLSRTVAFWLSRDFRANPPKVFLSESNGQSSQYELDSETWSFAPHLRDIAKAIRASCL